MNHVSCIAVLTIGVVTWPYAHKSFLWASDIFFTYKFTILAFIMFNFHNLRHVYFLSRTLNLPSARLLSIFPGLENRPITSVVTHGKLKIESLLQKVELGYTLRNMLPQLATLQLKFVSWQVESEGGNTGNNAFQLAMPQRCATSWAKMLPLLLSLCY